ncbi:MAG: outer membrane beta-barrel protein, partial [Gammaproteobacteria bacterium]
MQSTKTVLGSTALMLVLALPCVQAAEDVGRVYVKALGTYIDADNDRLVDNDVAGGTLGFGYSLSEHFNVEFDLQKLNLDGDPSSNPDQDQTAVNLSLMNIYNRSGLFAPYLLAGAGIVNTDIKDGSRDHDDLQLQGGAGVLTRLWGDRVSLRTEVLYRWQDASESNLGDVLVNAGFSVALGSKAVEAAPV